MPYATQHSLAHKTVERIHDPSHELISPDEVRALQELSAWLQGDGAVVFRSLALETDRYPNLLITAQEYRLKTLFGFANTQFPEGEKASRTVTITSSTRHFMMSLGWFSKLTLSIS